MCQEILKIDNFREGFGEKIADDVFFGISQLFVDPYLTFMNGLTVNIGTDFLLD